VSAPLVVDVLLGGAITGGLYALIALGLNLQYGLMRILNVAHGEFLMLGAYLTYTLHVSLGINPLLTVLVTGPAAFATGLVLHRTLYAAVLGQRDAAQAIESRSLLLSFGILFVAQNAALLIWSADLRGYGYLSTPVRLLGAPFAANRVVAAAVALAIGVGFYVFLRRSLTGTAVRALMQDPDGARLIGVDVRRVHAFCFGTGVAMSAVGGSLISMAFELTPFMGLGYTVTALVVIILGGLGSMLGSLVGGLALGVLETAAVYLAEYDVRPIVSYGVLSAILLLKPSGLLGR
jgi:branched-chain amino acid transport system permease protein